MWLSLLLDPGLLKEAIKSDDPIMSLVWVLVAIIVAQGGLVWFLIRKGARIALKKDILIEDIVRKLLGGGTRLDSRSLNGLLRDTEDIEEMDTKSRE